MGKFVSNVPLKEVHLRTLRSPTRPFAPDRFLNKTYWGWAEEGDSILLYSGHPIRAVKSTLTGSKTKRNKD